MSSKKAAPKKSVAKEQAPRPTNEQLFQEELQGLMKKYGCGISASPIVGFGQDGVMRLMDTKFSIVPIPKKPVAQAATAPAAK